MVGLRKKACKRMVLESRAKGKFQIYLAQKKTQSNYGEN
jgi:hypothetical protein